MNDDGNFWRLNVRLKSSDPLDAISVELPNDSGISFTRRVHGVPPDSDGLIATSYSGEIKPGARTGWRVELDDDKYHHETVQILNRSRRGNEPWASTMELEVPFSGASQVY